MNKILQKIKDWFFGKKEPLKPEKPPVIIKSYTGSFEDMPDDMKKMVSDMFLNAPPIFVGRPPMLQKSPFYEVKNGKVEEIVFVDPEDAEWGPWGDEEDDLSFL